ncbi:glycosyltransferase [Pectinatus brassicae]|uniref:Rhamnosyltransferase n=1 Tax=Pectinatus brassicae TaxID=862415 RepID=A0A840UL49_9FIRM|nr:glycosyltransferase [Pectinatus brassicae]MBB5336890.1 rhamnosyltransferase [Pectinatus brassicae]
MSERKKISIIIPTLNAEKEIDTILKALLNQTIIPDEIIIIDSSSIDNTREICENIDRVKFINIPRDEFDHGKTRTVAAKQAIGDYLLFMTQDAIPADKYYIENLIKPLQQKDIPMVSGRQYPREDTRYTEKLTRYFNYPEQDFVRSKKDIHQYGIKTFFVSDVCSAYRRKEYEEVGGFPYPIPVGEDMIMAAKLIYAGYSIAYAAEAKVIHSHNYTLWQQLSRNFDVGAYLVLYKKYFTNVAITGEGIKMVKFILGRLLKEHRFYEAGYYIIECAAKLIGNKMGLHYKILPLWVQRQCGMMTNYWSKAEKNNT